MSWCAAVAPHPPDLCVPRLRQPARVASSCPRCHLARLGGAHRGPDAEAVVHGIEGGLAAQGDALFCRFGFSVWGYTWPPPWRTLQEPAGCCWPFLAVWLCSPRGWHQDGFGSQALSAPLCLSRFRNPAEAAAFSPQQLGATLLSLPQWGTGVLIFWLGAVIGLGSWRQPLPSPPPGFGLGGQLWSGPVSWVTGACGYDAGCPGFGDGVVHMALAPSPLGAMVRSCFSPSPPLGSSTVCWGPVGMGEQCGC